MASIVGERNDTDNDRQIQEEPEDALESGYGQLSNQLANDGVAVKEEEVVDEEDVKPSLEELEKRIIHTTDDAFPSTSGANQKPLNMVLPKEEEISDFEIKEEEEDPSWDEVDRKSNEGDLKIEEKEEYEESEQEVNDNNNKHLKRIRPSAKKKKNLQCETCGKICAGSWQLKRHEKTHLDDDDPEKKTFKCEICPRAFLERKQLQQHNLLHLDNEEERRPYKCEQCDKRFSQRGGLTAHLQTHLPETDKVRHECDICGETFLHIGYLSVHKRIHLDKDQLPFVCDVCGQKFSISGNLRMHKYRKHNPKREEMQKNSRLTCDECGKTFVKKKALDAHKQSHQTQQLKCDQCGRRYLQLKALEKHKLSHSDRPMQLIAEKYEEVAEEEEDGNKIKTEYDSEDVKYEVPDEFDYDEKEFKIEDE